MNKSKKQSKAVLPGCIIVTCMIAFSACGNSIETPESKHEESSTVFETESSSQTAEETGIVSSEATRESSTGETATETPSATEIKVTEKTVMEPNVTYYVDLNGDGIDEWLYLEDQIAFVFEDNILTDRILFINGEKTTCSYNAELNRDRFVIEQVFGEQFGWRIYQGHTYAADTYASIDVLCWNEEESIFSLFWDSSSQVSEPYKEYGALNLCIPQEQMFSTECTFPVTQEGAYQLLLRNSLGVWRLEVTEEQLMGDIALEENSDQFGILKIKDWYGICEDSFADKLVADLWESQQIMIYETPSEEKPLGEVEFNSGYTWDQIYFSKVYGRSDGIWQNDGTWVRLTLTDGRVVWAQGYGLAQCGEYYSE